MNKLRSVLCTAIALMMAGGSACKEDTPPPPVPETGKLHAMVRSYSQVGMLRGGATVSVYNTLADAQAGTSNKAQGITSHNGSGAADIDIEPGQYYVVATWQNENGIWHTSDTADVKDPSVSEANGPQLVQIAKNHITNVTPVVDIQK